MRWFARLRSGSHDWTPVTNDDDTDMDDLMTMASGQYVNTEDENEILTSYHVRGSNGQSFVTPGQMSEPVFHRNQNDTEEMASHVLENEDITLCQVSLSCSKPRFKFPGSKWYLTLLAIFIALSFAGISVGLGCYSLLVEDDFVIDKSVKSFSIPNHQAYKNFEALMLARKNATAEYRRDPSKRSKRSSSPHLQYVNDLNKHDLFSKHLTSRLKRSIDKLTCHFKLGRHYESQIKSKWKMHVIYLSQGNDDINIFTKERLETVHEIENKIIKHPNFKDYCLRDPHKSSSDNGCVPLNSLLTYFYPSRDRNGNVIYDGMGKNLADVASSLKLAMNHESFYYFVDDKINKTYPKSHLLRSEVLFGAPLQGYSCLTPEQGDKFKDFVVTYIDLMSQVSTDKVQVLYGGNEIFDYEVTSSFWSDVKMAAISLIAIVILMSLLSMSLYLTVSGIVIIALSFPFSFFFYRVVFGIRSLGILNGAAAFVIIGIGVDDVFVFINIYRQSSHLSSPQARVIETLKTAGVSTFFTSFTTAAAFAANLASAIPAVYEFGLFMSLIVAFCWLAVLVMMPPLLYLHACFIEPLEMVLFSCFTCGQGHLQSDFDDSTGLNDPSLIQYCQTQGEARQLYQEDDVAMLDIQDPDSEEEDDNLLLMDDPTEVTRDDDESILGAADFSSLGQDQINNNNNDCLGRLIQKCLMFLTNRIVIRGRYFILGFYILLLAGSCILTLRLRPSTHPPQLFNPNTNIQRLLDLKANFSIIDTLHCDRCSGLYTVSKNKQSLRTKPPKNQAFHPKPFPVSDIPDQRYKYNQTKYVPIPPIESYKANVSSIFKTLVELFKTTYDNISNATSSVSTDQSDMPAIKEAHGEKKVTSLNPLDIHGSKFPDEDKKADITNIRLNNHEQTPPTDPLAMPVPVPHKEENVPVAPARRHGATSGWELHGNQQAKHETVDNFNNISSQINHHNPTSYHGNQTSTDTDYKACSQETCNDLKDRPLMELGATVYVVFGVSHISQSHKDEGHVLDEFDDSVNFDEDFREKINDLSTNKRYLKELCSVCSIISQRTDLVKHGSAQCMPSGMYGLRHLLSDIPECKALPSSLFIYHHQAPAHAEGGMNENQELLWLAFAFESTTSEGVAYFTSYKEYRKWEELMTHIKTNVLSPDSPLHSMFQTSQFWTKVLMEVVAVNSAIYGLILSMLICVCSVAVFSGHISLLLIVVVTIVCVIVTVLGVFYLAGWTIGAVEAVSLSILVGSSVDYCVHIVEGFVLPGRRANHLWLKSQSTAALRAQRTSLAVRHIGGSILCSALTTIVAAIPLTQTYIQPFAKFGYILLINTSVSVVVTLTLCVALLATFGPARFTGSMRSHINALLVTLGIVAGILLAIYISGTLGAHIPGPSGDNLFS